MKNQQKQQTNPRATLSRLLDMGETQLIIDLFDNVEIDTPEEVVSAEEYTPVNTDALNKLEWELKSDGGCQRCKLWSGRNKIVFGVGDPNAKIMFIGEAPGGDEDRIGEPFVGRAGQLLDKIFAAMSLSRKRGIYIANILKCRPPGNRDPERDEVEACMPFLLKQIELIRPEVICCLGRVAAQNLLDTDLTLGKLRNVIHNFRELPVLVTYHPAYLLRNPAGKRAVWEDMKQLLKLAGLPLPNEG